MEMISCASFGLARCSELHFYMMMESFDWTSTEARHFLSPAVQIEIASGRLTGFRWVSALVLGISSIQEAQERQYTLRLC
jgi:hypothetical protein